MYVCTFIRYFSEKIKMRINFQYLINVKIPNLSNDQNQFFKQIKNWEKRNVRLLGTLVYLKVKANLQRFFFSLHFFQLRS